MKILRLLQGGLNTDDSEEFIDAEDWSDAANIMAGRSYLSKNGEKENVRGTTSIVSGVDLTGCQHIGTIRSAEDDVSYLFFYHATPANQCIVKFAAGTISLVIRWEGLNFSPLKDHRINGGGIANGLLYFTDNYNEPRCVSLERYTDGSTPASEDEILHIKRGPLLPPEVDEDSFTGSEIAKPLDDVQFACQYEYEDGQFSVISPWTRLIRGWGEAGVTGALSMVSLRIHANETIPEQVTKIRMVARKGNNGSPFYWLDINRSAFEQTDYDYNYTEQNIGVVPTMYLKQFENVPRRAKTSCITKSRAWFGNYLEGYDTPKYVPIVSGGIDLSLSLIDSGIADVGPTFGPNSRHKFGIVFHDSQGRSCGVMTRASWEIATPVTMNDDDVSSNRFYLKYKIIGEGVFIPSWATHYSLVMTKDLTKTYFLNGSEYAYSASETLPYVWINNDGIETYSATYAEDHTNYFRIGMRGNIAKGMYYSFKEGDMAIVTYNNITYGPFPVRYVNGDFIYVDAFDLGNAGANGFEYGWQVFTPNTVEEQLYYEIERRPVGEVLDMFGSPVRSLDTSFYNYYGDCINTESWGSQLLPQMRFNPNQGAWDTDSGKPYLITTVGEAHKKHFMKYSSPFIGGINVNGLSEFNLGDEGSVPIEAIEIQKLQPTDREGTDGEVILAICNSNTYSVYVDEARVSTNDGQSLIISSTNVIGDVRKQRSGFGTIHPESVHEEAGQVTWYDHLERAYVRYSTNGIHPVSEYKVISHFEKQASLNSSSDLVLTGYDPFYKMVFVTFTNAETSTKKTIGFSTVLNRWISFYDFAPDAYVVGSKTMYSIKGSTVYSHDNTESFNNFYGVDYNSLIRASFNDGPDAVKEWKVIQCQVSPNFFTWADAEQVIGADALRVDLSNRKGQETSILYNEFDVDDDIIYGEIRGDENTGTVLTGDPMYSNTLQAEVRFAGGSYKQLTMLQVGFELARGHNL